MICKEKQYRDIVIESVIRNFELLALLFCILCAIIELATANLSEG